MKILISGDLVIQNTYNTENLNSNIVELFNSADLQIVNLEAPVSNSISKIPKTGPHLKSDKDSITEVLKKLKIDVVTLANNHILDFGESGLKDTISYCHSLGIKTVGAGKNLEEAAKTLYLDTAEGKIAIINIAENEWASASQKSAGANPMDIIENIHQIKEAKQNADFVLVILHGGNEHNPYPSPRMVKQYRFYAECGADAIIGHHTHCINGHELYKGVPIFYSLGNFLFTTPKRHGKSWYKGLVLQLSIRKGEPIHFEIIPVSFREDNFALSVLSGESKENVIHSIKKINEIIKNEENLHEKWIEFVRKSQKGFILNISPIAGIKNIYIRAILYRFKIHRLFLNQKYKREFLNRIRCEAHYDVTRTIFEHLMEKK